MEHYVLISSTYSRRKVYRRIYRAVKNYKNFLRSEKESSEKESVFFLDCNLGNSLTLELSLNVSLENFDFAEGVILTIIHPILDGKSLLEFCYLLDKIYRNVRSKKNLEIKLHFPYIAYGRQDVMFKNDHSVPIDVVIEIILFHCHSVTEMHFYDLHNDSCLKKIPQKIKTYNHSFNEIFNKTSI